MPYLVKSKACILIVFQGTPLFLQPYPVTHIPQRLGCVLMDGQWPCASCDLFMVMMASQLCISPNHHISQVTVWQFLLVDLSSLKICIHNGQIILISAFPIPCPSWLAMKLAEPVPSFLRKETSFAWSIVVIFCSVGRNERTDNTCKKNSFWILVHFDNIVVTYKFIMNWDLRRHVHV